MKHSTLINREHREWTATAELEVKGDVGMDTGGMCRAFLRGMVLLLLVFPAFSQSLQVNFDWKMSERFGMDTLSSVYEDPAKLGKAPAGWVDPIVYGNRWYTLSPSKSFINPAQWNVKLFAITPIDIPIKNYRWEIWGDIAPKEGR